MKIKIIVPVIGQMSETYLEIDEFLHKYVPEVSLSYDNINFGFSTVETELQGMFNGAEVAMKVKEEEEEIDGIFVDCFDDPGVYACREMGKIPVIGPYEAAISQAMLLGDRIGIITTDEAGILNEEKKARSQGLEKRIVSVRALDLQVDDIRTEQNKVLESLVSLCEKMVREDRVRVIALGCTAMFYVYEELIEILKEKNINVNVIEPTLCGVLALTSMIKQGFNNYIPGGVDFASLNWIQK